jgi:signal transduction histidine kinase/DNA-binding response OmpR family regulator
MRPSLLWQWSGETGQIVWQGPSSAAPAKTARRAKSADVRVTAEDGTETSLAALAAHVAGDTILTAKVIAWPGRADLAGAWVLGQVTGPGRVAGAVFARPAAAGLAGDDLASALIEGFEALPEAFVLYDADDRMLICNEQYRRLYPGVADMMEPGIYFPDLVRESVRRGVFRISEDADVWAERRISFHQAGIGFFEQQLSDGRWIQVSERRTASGGTTSIRADITVLKERERDLRAARAQAEAEIAKRTEFIAKVGHELRNPLNVVFGIAQLLDGEPMSKRHKTMMASLMSAARSMRDVLNDILDVTSVSSGHVDIRCEPVAPGPLLQDMVNIAKAMAEQKGLAFRSRIARDLPPAILTDPRRLRQIILNLMGNAFKYTEVGTIAVAAAPRSGRDGAVLRITITDSGPGIAKASKQRLFRPYVRTKEHVAAGIEGLGLGLSISEELAGAIGAKLGLAPAASGGTCAWVEVPVAEAGEQPVARPARVRPIGPDGPPLDILVVDDEQTNLIVAEALLKRLGHRVMTALDGHEGLRALQRRRYNAVLLDISMQDMSGLDVAREIVGKEGTGRGPAIIAMTGNVQPEDVKSYLAAGFSGFVEKPVVIDQLAEALAAVRRDGEGVGVLPPNERMRFPRADAAEAFDSARLDRMVADIGRDSVLSMILAGIATFKETAVELAGKSGEGARLGRLLHKVHAVAGLFGLEDLSARTMPAAGEGAMARREVGALKASLAKAITRMEAYALDLEAPALPPA